MNTDDSKDNEASYKISICTTCMNRLDDLRQTLPLNIADNADYSDVEFILLDYNSTDGLEQWVRQSLMSQIDSGRLAYFRTTRPLHYNMSHSRNVAFALATGDIVNNVDADNWTGPGFAAHVNRVAKSQSRSIVFSKSEELVDGRVGLFKTSWEQLGGYDESFIGYGYDDKDLVRRAQASGLKLVPYGEAFCRRIHTPDEQKMRHLEHKYKYVTGRANKRRSLQNIRACTFRVNSEKPWAVETVVRNFTNVIDVAMSAGSVNAQTIERRQ